MEQKSEFYTLKGYYLKEKQKITEAMEDYLEMLYRMTAHKESIHMTNLAHDLNVSVPSASKMITRLKELNLVIFEKYSKIKLSPSGMKIGAYLFFRHQVLTDFFYTLNKENFSLEQVEKIEHFVDYTTLKNLNQFNLSRKNKK